MALTRRQFLTLMGGSAGAAVLFQACGLPEEELLIDAPIEMPEDLVTGIDNWYATVCQQCDTSEGIVVRVMEGRAKKIEGNPDYPINLGKHSATCEAGLQALYHPDRINAPMVRTGPRGSSEYREISWDDAIGRLADQLSQNSDGTVLVSNPTGGHQGLVIDKFVDNVGIRRLTYEVLETGIIRRAVRDVFGANLIPEFDIDNSDYILSFGADFLNTWISPTRYSRGYGEFRQGGEHRGKLVHFSSSFTLTAANADEWVYVKPGTEGLVAMAIINALGYSGDVDPSGLAAEYDAALLEGDTGVGSEVISRIAHEVEESHHPLAIGGGQAAAHTNGLSALKAILSINNVLGNVGQKGGVLLNPESPLAGVSAARSGDSFSDFHRLAEEMNQGAVKVLLVKDADVYYGLPDSSGFKNALDQVPLIVSFSGISDDTTSMADMILPQNNYLEDWGTDVPLAGPGYQTIGFQQPVVRPFFEGRGDNLGTKNLADILMTVSQVMGIELGLNGDTFKEVIRDGARQLYELNRGSVSAPSFEAFWNGVLQRGGWWDTDFRYSGGGQVGQVGPISKPSFEGNGEFHVIPFVSSIGDGRSASLPWLQAKPDPISTATWQTWVEINHHVAEEKGIKEGDVVYLRASNGGVISALAMPNPATAPDVLSVPIGQGHRDSGRYAAGRGSNVLSLLGAQYDEDTGSLAWAATKVNLTTSGDWIRVPKFENTVPDFPRDEHNHIIELTTGDHE